MRFYIKRFSQSPFHGFSLPFAMGMEVASGARKAVKGPFPCSRTSFNSEFFILNSEFTKFLILLAFRNLKDHIHLKLSAEDIVGTVGVVPFQPDDDRDL